MRDGRDDPLVFTAGRTTPIPRSLFSRLQSDPAFSQLLRQKVLSLVVRGDMPAGVSASHFVGQAILSDGRRVVIRERRPGTLQALLNWTLPAELRQTAVASPLSESSGSALLEQFGRRFIASLAEYLASGRLKEYSSRSRRSTTPRGRIDIAATIADHSRAKYGSLVSRSPVLTADIHHNRLIGVALRAVEDYLETQPSAQDVVEAARVFAPLFDDVQWFDVQRLGSNHKAELFERILTDRRTSGPLRESLEFARGIVLHLGPWPDQEWIKGPTQANFVNLWLLFQEAVFELAAQLSELPVHRGKDLDLPLFENRPGAYVADPDLVIGDQSSSSLVVDCKFKEIGDRPGHSDVYQLLAHCAALGRWGGLLIYPGQRMALHSLGRTQGGIEVSWATVRPELLMPDLRDLLQTRSLPVR